MAKSLQDYLDEIDGVVKEKKPIEYGWNLGKKYKKQVHEIDTKKYSKVLISFDNPAPHLGRGWYIVIKSCVTSHIYDDGNSYVGVQNRKAKNTNNGWWATKEEAIEFAKKL